MSTEAITIKATETWYTPIKFMLLYFDLDKTASKYLTFLCPGKIYFSDFLLFCTLLVFHIFTYFSIHLFNINSKAYFQYKFYNIVSRQKLIV